MGTYITVQGDTFDIVAKKIYGNENLIQAFINANPNQIETVIFPAGTRLIIPELREEEKGTASPAPWRK